MSNQAKRAPFATQYTSLMLIILSVIVASRFQLMKQKTALASPPKMVRQSDEAPSIGLKQYSDLFIESKSEVQEDSLQALVSFLTNHDVDVDIRVFLPHEGLGSNDNESDARLSLAIARAITLSKRLQSHSLKNVKLGLVVVESQRGTLSEPVQAEMSFSYVREGSDAR